MRYFEFITEDEMNTKYSDYKRQEFTFHINKKRCMMILLSVEELDPINSLGKVLCEIDDIFNLEEIYKDTRLNIIVLEVK